MSQLPKMTKKDRKKSQNQNQNDRNRSNEASTYTLLAIEMSKKKMCDCSIWYILSIKWFSKWQKYVHCAMGSENPGKIDNSDLLIDITKENQYLVE